MTVNIVFEDDLCLAFEDISPQAKLHFLVIPKNHLGLNRLDQCDASMHAALLGHLMVTVAKVARQ